MDDNDRRGAGNDRRVTPPANGEPRPSANALQGSLRNLTFATVFLYAVVIVLGGAGFFLVNRNQQDTRDLTVQTTAALCALRFDLQSRVDQGEEFLKENPNGFRGFSPEAIQQQIDGQKRTIAALSVLPCPDDPGGN